MSVVFKKKSKKVVVVIKSMVGRFVWVFLGVVLATVQDGGKGASLMKRSAAPERPADDYPDYRSVRYDEYPVRILNVCMVVVGKGELLVIYHVKRQID